MSDYASQEEDIYIIPHNYQENGKILGIIDQQSFYIGMAWILIWLFVFYVIGGVSLPVKIVGFMVVAALPAGIIFVGFGHDTVVDFVKYYINFNKNAKVYHYEK